MRLVRKTRLVASLATLATFVLVLMPAPASAGTATAVDLLGGKKIGREVQRALFGVNLTSSGEETWTSTTLSFTDVNTANFDMTDLQGNGEIDGVAIFNDEGDVPDVFDAADVQVSDDFVAVGLDVTVNLSEPVPASAAGTYNYFITIATSTGIANGDDFTASLPSGCDAFDTGGVACPLIGGTNFGGLTSGTITADAVIPTAILTSPPSELNDNIVWTFSEPVIGVTEDNVVLRLDGSDENLGTAVSPSATTQTTSATINPDVNLTANEAYDTLVNPIEADTLVTDLAGNPVDLTESSFEMAFGFTPGLIRGTRWLLNNQFDPFADVAFNYGSTGDKFVVGDWDGDGMFTPGIVRGNKWYLNNGQDPNADPGYIFSYGLSTDRTVVGDWDGDGDWTPGIVRGNKWFLNNGFGPNADPELVFNYGVSSDRPIVGDWDGDLQYTPGIIRGNVWYLNDEFDPFADEVFSFGRSTDKSVAGDWDGDGDSEPGVIRGNEWFLAKDLDLGVTRHFLFGSAGDLFVVGDWDKSIFESSSIGPGGLPNILPGS